MGATIKSDFYQLYTNKLRVDLKSTLSDNITFAANFDYITYHGKTKWNILDFLASSITSTVPDGMEPFYVIPFSNRHFLDNAYIKLAFKHFDLTVGKQQISLGTGYGWNPTDVFNIKDPLDPTYEQPGHNAVRLENMNFLESPERRQLLGASTAGELLGLGVWAEYGYNWMENSKDFYELVVGADYTFDFQTYVMVEYYRNTLGKTNYEQYNLNDWMRLFVQEQKAVSRDQIYSFIQHPATDLLNVGISTIFSISDKSLALVPTLNYSLSENVEIMAYLKC